MAFANNTTPHNVGTPKHPPLRAKKAELLAMEQRMWERARDKQAAAQMQALNAFRVDQNLPLLYEHQADAIKQRIHELGKDMSIS